MQNSLFNSQFYRNFVQIFQVMITPTYTRRKTSTTHVGNLLIGSEYPIRIQSMANTDTNDINGSVQQACRIIDAGGELVRFTTQGTREVRSLEVIHKELNNINKTYSNTPLVADIHFNANVADEAAQVVEKVRINPGNYVDPARKFIHIDYTDAEYAAELERLSNRFTAFLNICKAHHTAIRIGVNHGSLSDRIMSRYGDTPAGMVESCMEFLRVCVKENFTDVVLSIKASNTPIMVETVLLLVEKMDAEDMHFPLHLGVTEAGEGEDGRIKSAVGIGALLAAGIGDTIRVSLSEAPEAEIPVAQAIVDYIVNPSSPRYTGIATTDTALHKLHVAIEAGYTMLVKHEEWTWNEDETLRKDILQAAGRIRYKTEYVSCPGCGRTLFDLQTTIARIKEATNHLKGMKIAVMGCIVNGPGEMADADYGYVGAGRGRVSLYRKKECILKNIPEEDAVSELLKLIAQDHE